MCKFCDGNAKRIENGYTYMDARIEKSADGIYSLHFDNSGDEYD